ncbi:MAG: hypothetical protein AAF725_22185 [Acidobacteriota bacterium]
MTRTHLQPSIAKLTRLTALLAVGLALPASSALAEPMDPTAVVGDLLPAARALETAYFDLDLPVGWDVITDDIDTSGQLTIGEQGQDGTENVFVLVTPGFTGDPMAATQQVADANGGSAPVLVARNGIDWAYTSYVTNNTQHGYYLTAHNGYKIVFTVTGPEASSDPGVNTIFETLSLH